MLKYAGRARIGGMKINAKINDKFRQRFRRDSGLLFPRRESAGVFTSAVIFVLHHILNGRRKNRAYGHDPLGIACSDDSSTFLHHVDPAVLNASRLDKYYLNAQDVPSHQGGKSWGT